MTTGRIEGIQWLRAGLSLFVVIWHLGGAGKTALWTDQYPSHVVGLPDVFAFQILLLAVPGFMLISNYLLASAHPTLDVAAHRAQRVLVLLLFWPLAFTIYNSSWGGVVAAWPTTPKDGLIYVLTAGYTVFYFFVSLLLTYGVTLAALKLPTSVNVLLLLATTAATAAAPMISIQQNWPLISAYWSPINFLPYAFAGIVIARVFEDETAKSRATWTALVLVLAGAGLAALEWQLNRHPMFYGSEGVSFPAYTRASLVLHAMAMLMLMMHWSPGVPAVVDFMAKHSLALYCLHLFMAAPLTALIGQANLGLTPIAQAWVLIPLTILASYAMSKVLMSVLRERLLF